MKNLPLFLTLIFLAVIVIFLLITMIICKYKNDKMFSHRFERTPFTLQDFPLSSFPNLKWEEFNIPYKNTTIFSRLYYYEKNEKFIIFCHGFGAGHMAYIKEIDYFCKRGFTVFAFDYIGCDLSGGKPKTFAYSTKNLRAVYKYLIENNFLSGKKVYLLGHSWGGYTALSTKINVDKIVAISPFYNPVDALLKLTGTGKFFKPFLWLYLFLDFFPYGIANANKTLNSQNIKTLIVKGDKDNIIPPQKDLDRPNIVYYVRKDKSHNPYYTKEAETLLQQVLVELNNSNCKLEFLKTVDYNLITRHDDVVFEKIISFLNE